MRGGTLLVFVAAGALLAGCTEAPAPIKRVKTGPTEDPLYFDKVNLDSFVAKANNTPGTSSLAFYLNLTKQHWKHQPDIPPVYYYGYRLTMSVTTQVSKAGMPVLVQAYEIKEKSLRFLGEALARGNGTVGLTTHQACEPADGMILIVAGTSEPNGTFSVRVGVSRGTDNWDYNSGTWGPGQVPRSYKRVPVVAEGPVARFASFSQEAGKIHKENVEVSDGRVSVGSLHSGGILMVRAPGLDGPGLHHALFWVDVRFSGSVPIELNDQVDGAPWIGQAASAPFVPSYGERSVLAAGPATVSFSVGPGASVDETIRFFSSTMPIDVARLGLTLNPLAHIYPSAADGALGPSPYTYYYTQIGPQNC